jgi:hypothetical protein
MPSNVMCRQVRFLRFPRFQVALREAPRVARKAGANQTKQGVSLDYANIRIFIRTIYTQAPHDMR